VSLKTFARAANRGL